MMGMKFMYAELQKVGGLYTYGPCKGLDVQRSTVAADHVQWQMIIHKGANAVAMATVGVTYGHLSSAKILDSLHSHYPTRGQHGR